MLFCKKHWEKAELLSALPLPWKFIFCSYVRRSFTEISHPRKRGKWSGSRKLPQLHSPPAQKATPAACVRGMWASKERSGMNTGSHPRGAASLRGCCVPQSSPLPRGHCQSRVGNGFPRRFTLLCSAFPHPAGLMPFYSCKANICAGGFLKIWLKINMILVCLYSGQSQPSDSFRGNILLRENLCFRKCSETSTFISHALSFGVLCTCFKWDGLELMDGVLPSVFYSLKISKFRHFIFIS